MLNKQSRHRVGAITVFSVLAWLAAATWAPGAGATSDLFSNNCSGCPGSGSGVAPYPDNTCAGCHAHGVHPNSSKNTLNVSATPDSTTYDPGDPMTVSVGGGYRAQVVFSPGRGQGVDANQQFAVAVTALRQGGDNLLPGQPLGIGRHSVLQVEYQAICGQ